MHIHRYERAWIILSGALMIIFIIAIAISTLALGVEIPGIRNRMAQVATAAPTPDAGWIRELAPDRYEVNLVARAWAFDPHEIRIPVGSTVTFYVHAADILHGFKIMDTTVSMMAIPGQMGETTYTFDKPGEYVFACHEYCGIGHHFMAGKVIVEER